MSNSSRPSPSQNIAHLAVMTSRVWRAPHRRTVLLGKSRFIRWPLLVRHLEAVKQKPVQVAHHQPSASLSPTNTGAWNVIPCSGVVIQSACCGGSGSKFDTYAYSSYPLRQPPTSRPFEGSEMFWCQCPMTMTSYGLPAAVCRRVFLCDPSISGASAPEIPDPPRNW